MLWLIVFLLWGFRISIGDTAAASQALKILLGFLVLLGVLQVVISTVEMMQMMMAVFGG